MVKATWSLNQYVGWQTRGVDGVEGTKDARVVESGAGLLTDLERRKCLGRVCADVSLARGRTSPKTRSGKVAP